MDTPSSVPLTSSTLYQHEASSPNHHYYITTKPVADSWETKKETLCHPVCTGATEHKLPTKSKNAPQSRRELPLLCDSRLRARHGRAGGSLATIQAAVALSYLRGGPHAVLARIVNTR